MILKNGRFMSDKQRKAMFSKMIFEDDPRELKLSDKIAKVLEEPKLIIAYQRPEILVHTGGKAGGSYAHIFTKELPKEVFELTDSGISYSRSL